MVVAIGKLLQKSIACWPAMLSLLIGACATTPSFNRQLSNPDACSNKHDCRSSSGFETNPPTVDDLLLKLQCEIQQAHDRRDPAQLSERQVNLLDASKFIVSGTLTADVLLNEGLNPSLSYIVPFKKSMTSYTRILAGQYAGVQHRVYTQQFTFDLDPEGRKDPRASCASLVLSGDLGIAEVMKQGLKYAEATGYVYDVPSPVCADKGRGAIADSARPTFGTTVEFTITYGLNGGPNWAVTHFKGPSNGNSNLIGYSDARKNTLQITFAPALPGGNGHVPACPSNAITNKDLEPLLDDLRQSAASLKEIVDRLAAARGRSPHAQLESEAGTALIDFSRNADKLIANIESTHAKLTSPPRPTEPQKEGLDQAKADAVRAAQTNNTQMLLQTLINTHP